MKMFTYFVFYIFIKKMLLLWVNLEHLKKIYFRTRSGNRTHDLDTQELDLKSNALNHSAILVFFLNSF